MSKRTTPLERAAIAAQKRLVVLNEIQTLISSGKSQAAALREVRLDDSTYRRWRDAYSLLGIAGLRPRTHFCGRRPDLEKFTLSRHHLELVRAMAFVVPPSRAWQIFRQTDLCPPALAERLQKSVPPSLCRLIAAKRQRAIVIRNGNAITLKLEE